MSKIEKKDDKKVKKSDQVNIKVEDIRGFNGSIKVITPEPLIEASKVESSEFLPKLQVDENEHQERDSGTGHAEPVIQSESPELIKKSDSVPQKEEVVEIFQQDENPTNRTTENETQRPLEKQPTLSISPANIDKKINSSPANSPQLNKMSTLIKSVQRKQTEEEFLSDASKNLFST